MWPLSPCDFFVLKVKYKLFFIIKKKVFVKVIFISMQ